MPNRLSQEELIEIMDRVNQGCNDSWYILYIHAERIARYFLKKWNVQWFEDFNSILLELHRKLPTFDPRKGSLVGYVKTWVGYRVRRNMFKNSKLVTQRIFDDTIDYGKMKDDGKYSPQSSLNRKMTYETIHECINELTETERTQLLDYYFHGKELVEIAKEYGVTHQCISIRLRTIRKKLKNRLVEKRIDSPDV